MPTIVFNKTEIDVPNSVLEQFQIRAVRQNGYAIQFTENPSKNVQLAAVQQDWRVAIDNKRLAPKAKRYAAQLRRQEIDELKSLSDQELLERFKNDQIDTKLIKKLHPNQQVILCGPVLSPDSISFLNPSLVRRMIQGGR
jgi:hypothetical protein